MQFLLICRTFLILADQELLFEVPNRFCKMQIVRGPKNDRQGSLRKGQRSTVNMLQAYMQKQALFHIHSRLRSVSDLATIQEME
jgi:hypothetical protein